jgi:hypothetical protein
MHACIVRRGDVFSLTDLTDGADVRVNAHLVKVRKLMIGDRIDIAGTEFVVCDPATLDNDVAPLTIVGDSSGQTPMPNATATAPIGHSGAASEDVNMPVSSASWQHVVAPPSPDVHAHHPVMHKPHPVLHAPHPIPHEPRESNATLHRVLAVFMVVGLVVAGVASYFVYRAQERDKLIASYESIMNSGAANEAPQVTIKKLELLRKKAAGSFPAIDHHLGVLIAEIQAKLVAVHREYQEVLRELDHNVAILVASEDFDAALKLYREAPARWQLKIQDERQELVSALQQKADVKRKRDEHATAAAREQEQQAAKVRAGRAFEPLVDVVLESLMTNDYTSARMRLDAAVADPLFTPLKSSLDQIADMLTTLEDYERAVAQTGDSGVASQRLASLAPALQAVIQLRNNEAWLAERLVQTDPQHIVSAALRRRLARAGDIDVEKQAMRTFYNVWKRMDPKMSNTIPSVEKATARFADRLRDAGRSDTITFCQELIGFSLHHRNTAFGRLYAPLFDSAYSAYLTLLEQADGGRMCGNAKVVKSEGGRVYAEAAGVDVPPEGRLSIFSYKSVFFNSAKNGSVPVATRIHIHDQQPYTVLGNSQIVSSFPGRAALPVPGQRVLIDSRSVPGQQMVVFGAHQFSFFDDFTSSLRPEWRGARETMSVVSRQLGFSSPRLRSTGSKLNSQASASDLVLYLKGMPSTLISLSFDMQRSSPQRMAVIIGDFSFLLGDSGEGGEGIYMKGNLVCEGALLKARVGGTERVAIQINSKNVSVTVNETSIACPVDLGDLTAVTDQVVFMSPKSVLLDNVRVSARKAPVATVAGISGDNREIAVSRGDDPSWANAKPGQAVYFFEPAAATNASPVVTATITEMKDDLVFCSVAKNVTWSITNNLISMTRSSVVDVAIQRRGCDAIALRPASHGLASWAVINSQKKHTELVLELPVRFPAIGYLSAVDEKLVHPQSAEVLGGFLGEGSRQGFVQYQTTVHTVASPILESAVAMGGVMLSAQQGRRGSFVELAGRQINTPPRGYSNIAAINSFWKTPAGAWTLNSGMMQARDAVHPVPMATVRESFPAGVQFDVLVSIDPSLSQAVRKKDWHHPMMLELFVPSSLFGVTFGMDIDNGNNGVSVFGRTASLLEPGSPMDSFSILPRETVFAVPNPFKGEAWLKSGGDHRIRVRRLKNAAVVYIDGRRVAYVSHPHLAGDVQLSLVAPAGGVRIGPASAIDLPASCQLNPKGAEFGDFGYVLKVLGDQVLIDADTLGLQLDGTVSIMVAERISGEVSKSVVLRRVATGVVTKIGPRTATVMLLNVKDQVAPGMKVLTGVQPDHINSPGY